MSATNSTVTLGLPLFVGTDKPAWLVDWNGAMNDIDAAVGNNNSDIASLQTTTTTQGSAITNLQTTVGNQTTSINTLINDVNHNTGDISTINSLIGNGTPTTTDHTIIGAINELHADQGDLANLTTTDKSSLVAAINEASGDASVKEVYSTTERKIGEWIDGSDLYEKTVSFIAPQVTTLGTNASAQYTFSSLGIPSTVDVIFIEDGFFLWPNGTPNSTTQLATCRLDPGGTSTFARVICEFAQQDIYCEINSTSFSEATVYVRVRYTKQP